MSLSTYTSHVHPPLPHCLSTYILDLNLTQVTLRHAIITQIVLEIQTLVCIIGGVPIPPLASVAAYQQRKDVPLARSSHRPKLPSLQDFVFLLVSGMRVETTILISVLIYLRHLHEKLPGNVLESKHLSPVCYFLLVCELTCFLSTARLRGTPHLVFLTTLIFALKHSSMKNFRQYSSFKNACGIFQPSEIHTTEERLMRILNFDNHISEDEITVTFDSFFVAATPTSPASSKRSSIISEPQSPVTTSSSPPPSPQTSIFSQFSNQTAPSGFTSVSGLSRSEDCSGGKADSFVPAEVKREWVELYGYPAPLEALDFPRHVFRSRDDEMDVLDHYLAPVSTGPTDGNTQEKATKKPPRQNSSVPKILRRISKYVSRRALKAI